MNASSPHIRPWLAGLAALLALAALHHPTTLSASAQEPIRVSGEVTCTECVITLDTIVTIGGLDGPGLGVIANISRAALDPQGRILISNPMQAEFSVFDSTGAFIRSVGGRGDGPGEYTAISQIDVGPVYIHVFGYHQGRTLLDHDFEVVRTDRFPGQVLSSLVTASDDVVFMASVGTPTAAGHKLHILRVSGEMESFGTDDSRADRSRTPPHLVSLTGDDRTLWAVQPEPNRISRWSLAPGVAPAGVFDREVEEFDRDAPSTLSWPRSANMGIMLDDNGLWIAWQTPDPGWTGRQRPRGPPSEPLDSILDSWIDLVDPATGSTLARYHTDGMIVGFVAGSRYLLGYGETDAGVPYLHLLEPAIVRPPAN